MKLSTLMIHELISERFSDAVIMENKHFSLSQAAHISEFSPTAAEETIYVLDSMPEKPQFEAERICCLCTFKPATPEAFGACIWTEECSGAEEMLLFLYKAFAYVNSWESQLLNAAVSGAGPQALMDACKGYFEGSYFSVYDSTYKIIAQADPRIFAEREARHTFIGQDVFLNYWQIDDGLSDSEKNYSLGFDTLLMHTSRIINNPGGTGQVISCGVFHRGIWFARIFMEGRFSPVKLRYLPMVDLYAKCLFNYFSNTVSEDVALQTSSNVIFNDMLSGVSLDNTLVEHYLSLMGWRPTDKFKMYLIEMPAPDASEPSVDKAAMYQLAQLLPYMRIINMKKNVVLIYNDKDRNMSVEEQNSTILGYIRKNKLKGVECPYFTDFFMLRELYILAEKAFSFGRLFSPEKEIYEANRFLSYDIVSNYMHQGKPEAYLHPDAVALHEFDKENNSFLVETLYRYLLNDKSHSRCAEKMFVHRRTFQYRLQKIFNIINSDLDDDVTRINLLNSLLYYIIEDQSKEQT